uniref:Uncharacterized protein n=1 Tax=Timema cristinae TaxID=61476 RepID=A0A7R9D8B2_TIMCR|nr:unnamed protein product [Timema cristinae]
MLKVNIFGKSEDEEDEIGSVLSRVKYSDVYTDSYDNDKVSSHEIEMDVVRSIPQENMSPGTYILEVYLHLCGGIESKPQFLSTPNRDSNHDVHIIGSLVYRESSALDYAATKAGVCEMGNRNVSASPAPPEAPASGEVKKLKACCACPETKRARDECHSTIHSLSHSCHTTTSLDDSLPGTLAHSLDMLDLSWEWFHTPGYVGPLT